MAFHGQLIPNGLELPHLQLCILPVCIRFRIPLRSFMETGPPCCGSRKFKPISSDTPGFLTVKEI